ncbi:hypothetical protein AB5N19_00582 [Seiridium cardinale]
MAMKAGIIYTGYFFRLRKSLNHHVSLQRPLKLTQLTTVDQEPYPQRSDTETIHDFTQYLTKGLPDLFKEASEVDSQALTKNLRETVLVNVETLMQQYISKLEGPKIVLERDQLYRPQSPLSSERTDSTSGSKHSTMTTTVLETPPNTEFNSAAVLCDSPGHYGGFWPSFKDVEDIVADARCLPALDFTDPLPDFDVSFENWD